jgi:preprotein translocase subunit YajC
MNLFETAAHAAEAGAPPPDAGLINLLFLGGFVLIFYFLLWRPQSKRRKEHQALMSGLQKGDEVVTAGGIANNVEMRIQKSAVGATLPKGTIKSLEES